MAKYSKRASEKVEEVMREKKRGTLRSGGSGKKVTSRKQAIAIGLSEARKEGAKVPRKKGASKRGAARKGTVKKGSAKKRTAGPRKRTSTKKSNSPRKSSSPRTRVAVKKSRKGGRRRRGR